MYALVLTGRFINGHDPVEAVSKTASLFGLDRDSFSARVVKRVPVSIREVPDPNESQTMRLRLMEYGMDAEVVFSDGVKWQIESNGSVRGPVPLAYLEGEYRAGRIGGDAQVKRVADSNWMPISSAVSGDTATRVSLQLPPGLTAALSAAGTSPPPPPPPPPAAQSFAHANPRESQPPPMPEVPPRPAPPMSGAATSVEASEAARIFVGKNTEFYVKSWGLDGSSGRSWNWPAFLFGPIWMMYRKMYIYAAIWTAIVFVDVIIEDILNASDRVSNIITFAMALAVGFAGNWLYRRHFEKIYFVSSVSRAGTDSRLELARRGNVSVGAAIAYTVGVVLLVVVGAVLSGLAESV